MQVVQGVGQRVWGKSQGNSPVQPDGRFYFPVATQSTPVAMGWGQALRFMGRKLNILITAGGTKEDIDPVRYLTNFSSGSLGRAFSIAAAERGHRVTLLAPKELPKLAGPLPEGVDLRPYRSTADLEAALKQAAAEKKWDVVIHSAAVSDYRPADTQATKISSDQEELVIRLVKTPKLIQSFRDWFGRAFLVGFKLLTNTPDAERHRIALAQIKKNRTNLCFENDLARITKTVHPARLVTPEGGAIPLPLGDKQAVARAALDFIEKREDVRWFQTVQDPTLPPRPDSPVPGQLLTLAQQSGLLVDSNGNLSVKLAKGQVAMTPRGVDKGQLTPEQILVIRANQKTRKVFVNSPTQKPSIDSSVADALYKAFPGLKATVHTHSLWAVGPLKTDFPYPCGVKEEAGEVIHTLQQAHHGPNQPFLVKLVHHGLILGLAGELTPDRLAQQWQTVQEDFDQHMAEIGFTPADLAGGRLQGILSPEGFVGSAYTHADGSVSLRLLPAYQGRGFGQELLKILKENNLTIQTVPECNVLAYYQKHGFEEVNREGRRIWLKPAN
jgi:GNAT superfamily N-acetyltransferase